MLLHSLLLNGMVKRKAGGNIAMFYHQSTQINFKSTTKCDFPSILYKTIKIKTLHCKRQFQIKPKM
ncbi:hypothetical protein N480_21830 [Pseudoalteromonas luteoviolacea S2607]|nr:hypothetical protein N480_21830 [Pseudoalteromonas luteoviolacea S2607]